MESTSFKSKFIGQINNSFGSGGMSLALNEAQFAMFIQYLKKDSLSSLPICKAVTIIGEQQEKPVWVLGRDLQITSDGEVIPEEEREYMWLDDTISEGLASVHFEEVLPNIQMPLDTSVLHRYVSVESTQQ